MYTDFSAGLLLNFGAPGLGRSTCLACLAVGRFGSTPVGSLVLTMGKFPFLDIFFAWFEVKDLVKENSELVALDKTVFFAVMCKMGSEFPHCL